MLRDWVRGGGTTLPTGDCSDASCSNPRHSLRQGDVDEPKMAKPVVVTLPAEPPLCSHFVDRSSIVYTTVKTSYQIFNDRVSDLSRFDWSSICA